MPLSDQKKSRWFWHTPFAASDICGSHAHGRVDGASASAPQPGRARPPAARSARLCTRSVLGSQGLWHHQHPRSPQAAASLLRPGLLSLAPALSHTISHAGQLLLYLTPSVMQVSYCSISHRQSCRSVTALSHIVSHAGQLLLYISHHVSYCLLKTRASDWLPPYQDQ